MSYNPYLRCDVSDFQSIVSDVLANTALSLARMRFGGPNLVADEDAVESRHEDVEPVGHPTDTDAWLTEALALGVADGEIVEFFPPAPADPDDDLQDEAEDEPCTRSIDLEEAA